MFYFFFRITVGVTIEEFDASSGRKKILQNVMKFMVCPLTSNNGNTTSMHGGRGQDKALPDMRLY